MNITSKVHDRHQIIYITSKVCHLHRHGWKAKHPHKLTRMFFRFGALVGEISDN